MLDMCVLQMGNGNSNAKSKPTARRKQEAKSAFWEGPNRENKSTARTTAASEAAQEDAKNAILERPNRDQCVCVAPKLTATQMELTLLLAAKVQGFYREMEASCIEKGLFVRRLDLAVTYAGSANSADSTKLTVFSVPAFAPVVADQVPP
jgi:hypothetical protein